MPERERAELPLNTKTRPNSRSSGLRRPRFLCPLGSFLTLDQGTTACLSVSQRQLTTKFHWPKGVGKGLAGLLLLVLWERACIGGSWAIRLSLWTTRSIDCDP